MSEYRINASGLAETERALLRLQALTGDLRPLWPRVSQLAISWLSRQFDSQGSFLLGERWEPLSPEYARRKAIAYPGRPILAATGALRRAATTPKRTATARSLTLSIEPFTHPVTGETIEPSWFDSGTERMPARPLLAEVLPHEAEAELEVIASRYVEEIIGRLGL